jgi:hypothetical protein
VGRWAAWRATIRIHVPVGNDIAAAAASNVLRSCGVRRIGNSSVRSVVVMSALLGFFLFPFDS